MSWGIGLLDASGTSEVQQDGRCVSRYMRKYLLVGTGEYVFASEPTVAAIVGITRGAPLSDDPNAICYSAQVEIGEKTRLGAGVQVRHVTYMFSTDAALPEEDDDDPTTRRTIWSISPTIQSTYLIRDRNGDVILDSAAQPFDGGVPADVRLGTVTATRNLDAAGYDRAAVLANSGKLNSVTWEGGEPGTVQVDISAQEVYQGAFHFWAETYTFNYNPLGWQPQPLNAGFYARTAADGIPLRILNSDIGDTVIATKDDECPEPQPLDADGVIVPYNQRPANCTFQTVDYFAEMDFADFNL